MQRELYTWILLYYTHMRCGLCLRLQLYTCVNVHACVWTLCTVAAKDGYQSHPTVVVHMYLCFCLEQELLPERLCQFSVFPNFAHTWRADDYRLHTFGTCDSTSVIKHTHLISCSVPVYY